MSDKIIKITEDELEEMQELIFGLVLQGCSHKPDGTLDHCAISTYEEGCEYLEKIGWLGKTRHRRHYRVKSKRRK